MCLFRKPEKPQYGKVIAITVGVTLAVAAMTVIATVTATATMMISSATKTMTPMMLRSRSRMLPLPTRLPRTPEITHKVTGALSAPVAV